MERHNTTKGPTYQVHLRNDASVDLDSPLETNRIDFFDAGIWLFQAGEWLFLPYHQIERIREERSDGEQPDPSSQ